MLKEVRYDMDLKRSFLASLENKYSYNTIASYESTLNKLGMAEQMYGISLCNANRDIRQAIVAECTGVRDADNRDIISRIGDYLEWAQANGFTTYEDDDLNYIASKSSAAHKKYFINRAEFEDYLDINMRPDEDQTIDIVYRIYAELIFCGFSPRDVPYIMATDVNWRESSISYMGFTAQIPADVMQRISLDSKLENYVVNISRGRKCVRAKYRSNYLINIMSFDNDREKIYSYLVHRISQINSSYIYKHTSPFDIFMSGAMIRAYSLSDNQTEYLCSEYMRAHGKIGRVTQKNIIKIFDSWVSVKSIMDC